MVKITAKEERCGCMLTSEGGGEDATFFEATINVFDSMNPNCTSESIAVEFLVTLVNYAVDEEADWAGGCEDRCDMQERFLRGAIAALESFKPHRSLDRAIQKAKSFIQVLNEEDEPTDSQTP
jgi:hypothetical protein